MKKIIVLLSLAVSFVALTGCASKCESCAQAQAPVHHDFKGEVSSAK